MLRETGAKGFESISLGPCVLLPRFASSSPPFVHVVNRLLRNPAHGVVGLLLGGDTHLDEQSQPASLVIMQTVLGGVGHGKAPSGLV
jgi:hypothetical protein